MAQRRPISRMAVEATVLRLGEAEAEAAHGLYERWIEEQPELAAFVLGSALQMGEAARTQAATLAPVVYEVFRVVRSGGLGRLDPGRIQGILERNRALIGEVAAALAEGGEPPNLAEQTPEPALLDYVAQAAAETEAGEELPGGDFLQLLLVLKTVIEALHEAPEA
ncbi:MAG: hypothetical protein D6739_09365 [Nitrospirae bacterium]|nr:MAG: hypothetical protein D6739_09365 [Nitrospirota bacterium]